MLQFVAISNTIYVVEQVDGLWVDLIGYTNLRLTSDTLFNNQQLAVSNERLIDNWVRLGVGRWESADTFQGQLASGNNSKLVNYKVSLWRKFQLRDR